jgi:hypothetical protein
MFSYYFCLTIDGSGDGDGSGSVSLTKMDPEPDPQHCCKVFLEKGSEHYITLYFRIILIYCFVPKRLQKIKMVYRTYLRERPKRDSANHY